MPAARRPSSASGARRSGAPAKGSAKRRDPRADGRERSTRRPEGEEGARPGRRTTTSGRRPAASKGDDKRPARRVPPRQVARPQTTAEVRAAEVRARRPPRPPRPVEVAPPPWEPEQWVVEAEPIRQVAEKATARATRPPRSARPADLAPEITEDLARAAEPGRLARYQERLSSAADALDRGRYEDARRMVQPVLRDVPELAFAHELAGLASYRLGQWRKAATQLEAARLLDGTLNHHAVLADCYRALRRYTEVDQLWRELREGSPSPALLAEGRIVAAGAQADRGDLNGALRTMSKAGVAPKKVREHHLRQWYVLGDLSDRSGDVIAARRWFGLVAQHDGDFADVQSRLRSLGR